MKTKRTFLLLAVLFLSFSAFAETITVCGAVTDEDGYELIGVTIREGNTANGTLTDIDGKYCLTVKKGSKLIFSYIGMINQTVVADKKEINIMLKEDGMILTDVVVTGYLPQAKRSITGATTSIAIIQPSEKYSEFDDNKFLSPLKHPLSTFSTDVDTESYSNMRRMVNNGDLPNKDAIRVEEMVNYFDYDYPSPKGKAPVSISTEISNCPWNASYKLARIGIKAKEIPVKDLPKSNIVFLIDVSGSMYGAGRLGLVKSSLKLLTNQLREGDMVSIVTYANGVNTPLEATPAKERMKIMSIVDELEASGGTSGGKGIEMAYEQARKNFVEKGNNRVILCTDGDFNIGINDDDELVKLIEKERKSGVYLSILGYGMGNYQSEKMQALAQAGNGNHAYIDNIQEANKVLVKEFGATLHTVADDVKLQVEFNPARVHAYRLIGYETRLLEDEDFNDDTVDAAEIGMGHTVTALYEIVPVGIESDVLNIDPLKYQEENKIKLDHSSKDIFTVKLRYKEPGTKKSKMIEQAVLDDSKKAGEDFKFAAAVAMYGQLLRDSNYTKGVNYDDVIKLAKESLGKDKDGYRSEFIRLVESVKLMSEN